MIGILFLSNAKSSEKTFSLLILSLILVGIIYIVSGIIFSKIEIKKSNEQKQIKHDFINQFKLNESILDGLLLNSTIYVTEKTRNYYVFNQQRWLHANADGSKDNRYKTNYLITSPYILYFEEYRIEINDLQLLIDLINNLRKQGYFIEEHEYEEKRRIQYLEQKNKEKAINTIEGLLDNFSDTPYEFEEYCASILRAMGYKAETTSKTNDSGYDIIYETKDRMKGIAECKCYAQHVTIGRPLLQKLVGANATVKADRMTFITTSDFSQQAVEYANQVGVELINGVRLIEYINKYLTNDFIDSTADEYIELTIDDFRSSMPPDVYKSTSRSYPTNH